MRPVAMESLTSDTDAYRAALATVLGLELAEVPSFTGLSAGMQWNAWLASELNLVSLVFQPGEVAFPPGYWIARVSSPYPGYDVHSVVVAGTVVAHDPHPEPQELDFGGLLMIEMFVPLDPSEPSGRFAL